MNIMSNNGIQAFKGCYMMQPEDIAHFADTLSDGFGMYGLFRFICNGDYSHRKMQMFWAVTIALNKGAICIADSKDANSVLIYLPPGSKEPSIADYLKAGGLRMLFTLGLRSALKLLWFDNLSQRVAKRHKTDKDGYLMAFATRLSKQGQHYGKPLMEALLSYLDSTGEGCYLETLKEGNVGLYGHFSFCPFEQLPLKKGGLTLYAMYRPGKGKEKEY